MLIFDPSDPSSARWADFARAHLPMGMPIVPWDEADTAALGLTDADRPTGMWWIGSDGVPRGGGAAAASLTKAARGWHSILGPALLVPGVARATSRLIPSFEERS